MKSQKILGVLTVTPMAVVPKEGRKVAVPIGSEHVLDTVEISSDPVRQELTITSKSGGGAVRVGYTAAYANHFAEVFGVDPRRN
jgi:hypothetical protein